jgi:hypothetical protein
MKREPRETAQLGELIVAVFDIAARYSADPREISHLATRAVMEILRRARESAAPLAPAACTEASASS